MGEKELIEITGKIKHISSGAYVNNLYQFYLTLLDEQRNRPVSVIYEYENKDEFRSVFDSLEEGLIAEITIEGPIVEDKIEYTGVAQIKIVEEKKK